MKIRRYHKKAKEISLIPLINVVFLLLIFFMVTGTIEKLDIFEVAVPKSEEERETLQEPTTVYLSADGKMAVNNSFVTKKDLSTVITTVLMDDANQIITIKADGSLAAKEILWVMNTIHGAGGENISLITQVVK